MIFSDPDPQLWFISHIDQEGGGASTVFFTSSSLRGSHEFVSGALRTNDVFPVGDKSWHIHPISKNSCEISLIFVNIAKMGLKFNENRHKNSQIYIFTKKSDFLPCFFFTKEIVHSHLQPSFPHSSI